MSKTKAERAEQKAKRYVAEKLGEEYELYDLWAFTYIKEEKAKAEVEKAVKVFKTLFATKDEELLLALWNKCTHSLKKVNVRSLKAYFTKEEYDFLKKIKNAVDFDGGRYGFYTINKDIVTERLILRAMDKTHNTIFKAELEKHGEFLRYYMLERWPITKKYMRQYDISCGHCSFAVLLRDTEEMIGLVAIENFIHRHCQDGRISYCIFKDFRRKGYAKEAIEALIKTAFQGNLYMNKRTPYNHLYKRKRVDITLLRAEIESSNLPSKQTAKSLGFEYEGVVHRALFDGKSVYDKENYYITKEIWEAKKGD